MTIVPRPVRGLESRVGFTVLVASALIAISGRQASCQACTVGIAATTPFIASPGEQTPAFEVATIKPWDGKRPALPLRDYIMLAFGISPNIAGRIVGPDWIDNTRYVIQGKTPDSINDAMKAMTLAERAKEYKTMQQSLLADRFQLKAHFETREMPVYELVAAKGGSKLKEDPDPVKRQIGMGASSFRGTAPIAALIGVLECSPDLGGREVVDKTGLTGFYDFSLKWTPMQTAASPGGAPSPDVEGPSLFTALGELGLKLVPAKGPGQVLVIDHIERPSEN